MSVLQRARGQPPKFQTFGYLARRDRLGRKDEVHMAGIDQGGGCPRARRGVAATVAALVHCAFPAMAQAGLGAAGVPIFPTSVTVGNTGISASIEVQKP